MRSSGPRTVALQAPAGCKGLFVLFLIGAVIALIPGRSRV
jgi:hypothetical protein